RILPEQGEALATDFPVLRGRALIALDAHLETERHERGLRARRLEQRLLVRILGELGHEDELRYAALKHHADLRQEGDSELRCLEDTHLRQHLRKEFYSELESVIVIGLEALWIEGKHL